MTSPRDHYSAAEAAQLLGISRQSLYAYVSRGLIRAERGEGRTKRYSAQDIERLHRAQLERHDPERVAQHTLDWQGHPVLETHLSGITQGQLQYRGQPIEEVVRAPHASLERVAALLWYDDARRPVHFVTPELIPLSPTQSHLPLIQQARLRWVMAEQQDMAAYRLDPESVAQTGERVMGQLLGRAAPARKPRGAAHGAAQHIAKILDVSEDYTHLIDLAMMLCADHELNASTFATRVAASARATPYAACSAGLAALLGLRHGGTTLRIGAWLDEVMRADSLREAIITRQRRGERWIGLGHPLYPQGEPRATILWQRLTETLPASRIAPYQALFQALDEVLGASHATSNIDLMLLVLMRLLGQGSEQALLLFATGRTVGWIAHVIEQYQSEALIRPRARYSSSSQ